MSLTYGTGPLGQTPAGRFNLEVPREELVYVEELPRWVRVRFGGETVVDTKRPKLVHVHAKLPVFHFEEDDVRMDVLRPNGDDADTFDVVVGDRVAESAAKRHRDAPREGLLSFDWNSMDEWLEEEEPMLGHARDPYSRIDVRETSRHIRVSVNGELVAETRRAKVLFEAGLPPRWYIPEEDVRMELLEPTDSTSTCAYKGHPSYWSVGDEDDVVWTYRDPLLDALPVKDMLCFYNERVDIEVDGEREERPRTQWSR